MKQNLLAVISLVTLVAVGFASLNTSESVKPKPILEIPNNIDYYLKNTQQKNFKTDGSIDFMLTSDLLEHYKKEDKSLMLNPDITLERENTWQINAQKGNFYHPEEVIEFKHNVILDKHSKIKPFKVLANTLFFKIQQDLVISNSDVKVSADNWNIKAKTMSLDMNSEVHQFTKVTARYRNDKNT